MRDYFSHDVMSYVERLPKTLIMIKHTGHHSGRIPAPQLFQGANEVAGLSLRHPQKLDTAIDRQQNESHGFRLAQSQEGE